MTSARIIAYQVGFALLLVAICAWIATQWAAAMLGYQPALGAPMIEFLGLKIYAPWKLFVWWLAFDAQAPDVFARAGIVAAFGGIASGVVAIGGAARRASFKSQATTYGSAHCELAASLWLTKGMDGPPLSAAIARRSGRASDGGSEGMVFAGT
jgi:type IV secretion system protein VirD4